MCEWVALTALIDWQSLAALRHAVNEALMGVAFLAPVFVAKWQPTDKAREMADDIREEVDARFARKESAELVGLPQSDWSEQLNCQQPLNIYRLFGLLAHPAGQSFWNALLKRMARRQGGEYIDPQTVTLLNGAARIAQNRPVISMLMPESEKAEVA